MEDVPRLMNMIPQEEQTYMHLNSTGGPPGNTIFNDEAATPFEIGGVEGINAGAGEQEWIVERSRHEYDQVFGQLAPQKGKISGAAAKQEMVKSKLVNLNLKKIIHLYIYIIVSFQPNNVLGRIWKLSDIDKDGMLDMDEWALSQHLSKYLLFF